MLTITSNDARASKDQELKSIIQLFMPYGKRINNIYSGVENSFKSERCGLESGCFHITLKK